MSAWRRIERVGSEVWAETDDGSWVRWNETSRSWDAQPGPPSGLSPGTQPEASSVAPELSQVMRQELSRSLQRFTRPAIPTTAAGRLALAVVILFAALVVGLVVVYAVLPSAVGTEPTVGGVVVVTLIAAVPVGIYAVLSLGRMRATWDQFRSIRELWRHRRG